MIQNSLPRLLEGIAAALHEHVLPSVDDGFVQAQVRAAIELLGNLSTRVSWHPDYLSATIERIRPVLTLAVAAAPAPDLPTARALMAAPIPTGIDQLVECRTQHLRALAEVQQFLAATEGHAEIERAVRSFLRWQLRDEQARLRTSRFGAPG